MGRIVKGSPSNDLLGLAGKIVVQNVRAALGKDSYRSIPRGDTSFVPPTGLVGDLPTDHGHDLGDAQQLGTLLPWLAKALAAPLTYDDKSEPQQAPLVPEAKRSSVLLGELSGFLASDQISDHPRLRLRHGHGQASAEIWAVRRGELNRVPDLVVFPATHEQVVQLVRAARKHHACCVPFGGGSNGTYALRLPPTERRFVIAVDMARMNRIRWIDPVNLLACVEAGAAGRHLARELGKYKLVLGHEPDSPELSTLGGWIATNASSTKQNRYGEIDDVVLDMQVVMAHGGIEQPQVVRAKPFAINPKQLMFGSEGQYGIITSAVVRLCKAPEVERQASAFFPTLGAALDFLYDLQRSGTVPASVQVLDNTQYHLSQALGPRADGVAARLKSRAENLMLTQLKGFDPRRLALSFVVFEGSAEEVEFQEKAFQRITKAHGGVIGGASSGTRANQVASGMAHVRALMSRHWVLTGCIEISVRWSSVLSLYERVRERLRREHEARRLPGNPFFSARIAQVYSSGARVCFDIGFHCKGVADPVRQYAELERGVREEILLAGGSLLQPRSADTIGPDSPNDMYSRDSLELMRRVKEAVDPEYLFGVDTHGAKTLATNNHGVNGGVPVTADPR